jgi:hypothetical protein
MRTQKIAIIAFGIVLMSCIVSAGFFDMFDKITGRATSQPTNVSVAVAGTTKAQVTYVSTISNVDLNESSYKAVTFNTHMYDADGVSDLNDTSVSANFSRTGEALRETSLCTLQNDVDGYTANYSCSINMWYWDGAGTWNITVRGKDIGNGSYAYNTTTYFTVNQLKAMVVSPAALTWPTVSSGAENQTSNNDPTTINNTGNYNGTIDLTAIDLYGETSPSQKIPANNFTTGLTTSGANPECIATVLVNGSVATITGSVANRGNLSAGSGAGQEEFYYCIPKVPLISSQTYSTSQGGSWTIAY